MGPTETPTTQAPSPSDTHTPTEEPTVTPTKTPQTPSPTACTNYQNGETDYVSVCSNWISAYVDELNQTCPEVCQSRLTLLPTDCTFAAYGAEVQAQIHNFITICDQQIAAAQAAADGMCTAHLCHAMHCSINACCRLTLFDWKAA